MKFEKGVLTGEQHYDLLLERGLIIPNKDKFIRYLKTIGYYRLTGYMYPFQLADGSHKFREEITFDFILGHYLFDKKLRIILLDAIERIEVALRTRIGDILALKHGPHWYLNDIHFNNKDLHNKLIEHIREYCSEANELFIKSYNSKYNDPELPPSWMVMETLTLGKLTSLFENLKDSDEKKIIASDFGTVVPILESWLKSINYIRNCCAHHSRIWNRKLSIKPTIPSRKEKRFLVSIDENTNKQLYGIMSCMLYLTNIISPNSAFKNKVISLFEEYPFVNKYHMGFYDNFRGEDLWK